MILKSQIENNARLTQKGEAPIGGNFFCCCKNLYCQHCINYEKLDLHPLKNRKDLLTTLAIQLTKWFVITKKKNSCMTPFLFNHFHTNITFLAQTMISLTVPPVQPCVRLTCSFGIVALLRHRTSNQTGPVP